MKTKTIVALMIMLSVLPIGAAEDLLLENKDGNWDVIDDGTFGMLEYNAIGPEFEYTFDGHGLSDTTDYSLIYYADKPDRYVNWGGNNPGALLGEGTSDTNGHVGMSDSIELNMNLPHEDDANYGGYDYSEEFGTAHGAKIWLVTSSDYDKETNCLTLWNPGNYLFETDLIEYTDAEVPEVPEERENCMSSPGLGIGWHGSVVGDYIPPLYTWAESGDKYNHHTTDYFPLEGTYTGVVICTPARIAGEPLVPNGFWDTAKGQRILDWKANS